MAHSLEEDSRFYTKSFRSDRERHMEEALNPADKDGFHVRVYVDLDDNDEVLRPGMTGYARIEVSSDFFWRVLGRHVLRFVRTEVWSWLP